SSMVDPSEADPRRVFPPLLRTTTTSSVSVTSPDGSSSSPTGGPGGSDGAGPVGSVVVPSLPVLPVGLTMVGPVAVFSESEPRVATNAPAAMSSRTTNTPTPISRPFFEPPPGVVGAGGVNEVGGAPGGGPTGG